MTLTYLLQTAELVVPIPLLASGEPDWRVVQEVVHDIRRVHDDFTARGMYPVVSSDWLISR